MTLKIGYEPIKGDPEDDSCDHSDNDDTQDEEEFSNPEVYTEEEMEAVEGHIQQYFGEIENVFHELVSPDIHVDICMVPPTEERDYYTLVTMGMGAHRMNVPKNWRHSLPTGRRKAKSFTMCSGNKNWRAACKSVVPATADCRNEM